MTVENLWVFGAFSAKSIILTSTLLIKYSINPKKAQINSNPNRF